MNKSFIITFLIILVVIIFSIIILTRNPQEIPKDVVQCIGKNSVLYVKNGCSACITQENMFGKNYEYLNVVDCFDNIDKCANITAIPTWIIDGEKYVGLQSIDKLKEATGC